ncbi:bifunctional diguanylate cyclase/phosphodiesterase [Mycolicibacterium sp. P1-5]|uniref:putative bifunctional diguanylate cyclase/phosphodiesterase n=1 Tax=Mycolicibacterium sp. P1-5 TaxID=2024617 RepID=UPI0011ED3BAF|nr:EAL domain-containing protein [Mycolicibacterium sp. P1-5]KAA0108305.1 EAL domain-containing protein [Mycolicibacterium sp. P1-5]
MSFGSRRLHCGLTAVVVAAAAFNALGLWGVATALRVQFAIEAMVCVAALAIGLVVLPRVTGLSRWWRMSLLAAVAIFLAAELLWQLGGSADQHATAPWQSVVAYFVGAFFFSTAMFLLIRAGRDHAVPARVLAWPRVITTVLDGLISALAFTHLVYLARSGAMDTASLPRSTNTAVVISIAGVELVVVMIAILVAMWYPPYRLGRANYMLLATAVIILVSSDRMLAYFRSIDVSGLDLWIGTGFIFAPVLIAWSLPELPPRPRPQNELPTNWAQLTLPYVGFMGSTALLTFQVIIGRGIDVFFAATYLALALLVATRYLVAMRIQRMLTEQLVDAKRRLAHQAHHDALTNLPNRLLLAQRLDDAIRAGPFVLIFVDIDDFKDVNDRFGHAAGDELLCAISGRLRSCLGRDDTLARIGGDEFAILVAGEVGAPEIIADQLRVALRSPFSVHGTSIRVRASMGLVSPGHHGLPPTSDDLLRQADISMYTGKRLGKDTAVVYRPAFSVSEDFPTALRQAKGGIPQGFRLKYQPIVALPQGTPVAVEALARWTTPSGMQIPPQTFVALAEANGMGAQLDALVLDQACAEIQAADMDMDVHVNIGAARLGNPEFEGVIARTLARHGLSAARLVLEITETVPIVDLVEGAAAIRRLNDLGIRVALDDFGAGYNSLTYLHELPVQIVKLDRGLALGVDPARNLTLYRSVIGLCQALHLNVIAEGIETADQAETIFMAGCGLAQGHLFGRATALTDIGVPSTAR